MHPASMTTKTMKTLILPSLLALLSASTPAPQADSLAWRPTPGARVQRSILGKHTLTAERMEQSVNGESTMSQRLFDLSTRVRLRVTDELREAEAGRPSVVRRYYEQSTFSAETTRSLGRQQTKDAKFQGAGSIVDTGVVFTWVPEDGNYGRYYDAEEGVEEALPGLEADLSLRQLLPEGPVEIGAEWTLTPGVLRFLFTAGGDTDYQLDADKGINLMRLMRCGVGMNLEQIFGGEESGEVTARWLGTEEVDGKKLALIDLAFDCLLSRDIKDRAAMGMTVDELAMGFEMESALVELALKGGGRVRWDLGAGRLHDTIDIKASERVQVMLTLTRPRAEGEEPETNVQVLVMAGFLEQSITCEAVE